MTWQAISRGSLTLHGRDCGAGLAVVFQHGLGGSESQVAEVFPDAAGIRRLTLDCRGQGRSPAGMARDMSIATFAEDVLAFATSRDLDRFVLGGISMGAAIALRIAVRHPERVRGLVLVRPAWLWDAAPDNMQPYAEVARHLRDPDRARALRAFEASPIATRLARHAPDNLVSLKAFFVADDRDDLAALLSAIASDGPGIREQDLRAIAVPTLVIGTDADLAHPIAFAETLAATIPGATLARVTPKSTEKSRYVAELRAAIAGFLATPSLSKGSPS